AAEDRAMEALRRSIDAGFADVALIQTDPDLNSLRSRPDFQAMLAQLTKSKAAPNRAQGRMALKARKPRPGSVLQTANNPHANIAISVRPSRARPLPSIIEY